MRYEYAMVGIIFIYVNTSGLIAIHRLQIQTETMTKKAKSSISWKHTMWFGWLVPKRKVKHKFNSIWNANCLWKTIHKNTLKRRKKRRKTPSCEPAIAFIQVYGKFIGNEWTLSLCVNCNGRRMHWIVFNYCTKGTLAINNAVQMIATLQCPSKCTNDNKSQLKSIGHSNHVRFVFQEQKNCSLICLITIFCERMFSLSIDDTHQLP